MYLITDIYKLVVMVPSEALEGATNPNLTLNIPQVFSIDIKGKPILYVKMYKDMYGYIRVALLFYEKLASDMKVDGIFDKPPMTPVCPIRRSPGKIHHRVANICQPKPHEYCKEETNIN